MPPVPNYVAIQRLADSLVPDLRKQFLAAVKQLQGRISLAELARAAERGQLTIQITQALDAWPADLRNAVAVVNQAFTAAGALAATQLSAQLGASTSFDLTNPYAVDAAQQRTAFLVREITTETRSALQTVIRRSIVEGMAPAESARVIRPLVGLTSRQANAVMSYRAGLIESGLSRERAALSADTYAAQLQRRRAMNIARTETVRASNDGQLALWRQAQADGLLKNGTLKKWIVTPDDRLCPRCQAIAGVQVPLDQLFPVGVMGPPLHPQCRCALRTVGATKRGRQAA